MVNNATDSYAMGEIFDGDAGYACMYQRNGLDGFLNFPVYFQVPCPVIEVDHRWSRLSIQVRRLRCPHFLRRSVRFRPIVLIRRSWGLLLRLTMFLEWLIILMICRC